MSQECRDLGLSLRKQQESIFQEWEKRVRARLPVAEGKSRRTLRDHLPPFLESFCSSLEQLTGDDQEFQLDMSRVHGETRAALGDYDLEHVVIEYSILRAVLFDFILRSDCLKPKIVALTNRLIDEAIAAASQEFMELRKGESEQALEKQKMLNAELERFAAIAAHDLRSPLATMTSLLDMWNRSPTEKRTEELVPKMRKILARSLELLDRLLDNAKAGAATVEKEKLSVRSVIEQAAAQAEADLTAKKGLLRIEGDGSVYGDRNFLAQLFQNLLSNSAKYSSDRPLEVKVSIIPSARETKITVEDNGQGFGPEVQEEIFKPFKSFAAAADGRKSLGLGLDTCRKIVRAHGGEIHAEGNPRKGATFRISLPAPPA